MTKVLIVGSQHGNEPLGFHVYAHMRIHHPDLLEYCEFYVANPLATQLGRRYIESDMNRSYGQAKDSYESRQAQKLIDYIEATKPDIVLDLHTTTCIQPPSLIITQNIQSRRAFIKASSIKKVMVMQGTIADNSLIGFSPIAISIEVSDVDLRAETYDSLIRDIRRFIHVQVSPTERSFYTISDKLKKDEFSQNYISKLQNFEFTEHGFAPYLVGPDNSYSKQTDYLGFKAVPTTDYRL